MIRSFNFDSLGVKTMSLLVVYSILLWYAPFLKDTSPWKTAILHTLLSPYANSLSYRV